MSVNLLLLKRACTLWFNFTLGFHFIFFVLGMGVSKENHFKPGIKLNHLHNYKYFILVFTDFQLILFLSIYIITIFPA